MPSATSKKRRRPSASRTFTGMIAQRKARPVTPTLLLVASRDGGGHVGAVEVVVVGVARRR